MQRIGKSDIKVGVGAGGERRGEVISGDRANRKQRGGGTIKDCNREIKAVIEKMVIEGKIRNATYGNTRAGTTLSREGY